MSFHAQVIADSYNDEHASRLTTLEITFPRFILAELNTHRAFSRNSSSSRAIPTWKILDEVRDNPFIPDTFGSYQPGMSSGKPLEGEAAHNAKRHWLEARDQAMYHAACIVYGSDADKLWSDFKHNKQSLPKKVDNGAHKELVNRLLEPFMWQTAIVSSTKWDNFFHLRIADNAQPQIKKIAEMIKQELDDFQPKQLDPRQWHVPFVYPEEKADFSHEDTLLISAGRCARVSYLNHHLDRAPEKDIELAHRLLKDGHMSPFEHQARLINPLEDQVGNFPGWIQQRHIYDLMR